MNVWIALAADAHIHHDRARTYWRTEGARTAALYFCRLTMLGFLRLLTQPKVMGRFACAPGEAIDRYMALLALPEVEFANEPPGCEEVFLAYGRAPRFPSRLWTDAYLAAFALSFGLRLVTFDADFARFEGLDVLRLE